jgi:hypothetical protein
MDIGADFESLKLRPEQLTLAWETRAKIMWGEESRAVRGWLSALGIDSAGQVGKPHRHPGPVFGYVRR